MKLNPVLTKMFLADCKRYLQHKIILGNVSAYYKQPAIKPQLKRCALIFGDFLKNPSTYPVGQLALLIKRNEDLITILLPIPGNPSYQNSKALAEQIIKQSTDILETLNLTELI